MSPTSPTHATPTHAMPSPRCAVLHGRHPLRGYAVTWHLTPLPPEPGEPARFLVEQAVGEIDDDVVWQLAEREREVMSAREAAQLVRRVAS